MTLGVMKPQQNLLRPPQYFSGIFGDHQQPWNTGNDTKNSFLKDYLSAEAKSLKHKVNFFIVRVLKYPKGCS